jgi:hypothetical protein
MFPERQDVSSKSKSQPPPCASPYSVLDLSSFQTVINHNTDLDRFNCAYIYIYTFTFTFTFNLFAGW